MKETEKKTNLIIGVLVTATFIYLSFTCLPFFESLEKVSYEIEMRPDTPRNPGESKVAIVKLPALPGGAFWHNFVMAY